MSRLPVMHTACPLLHLATMRIAVAALAFVASAATAAGSAAPCAGGITRNFCMKQYVGNKHALVLRNFTTASRTDGAAECCAACAAEPGCVFWMWNHGDRAPEFYPAMCWVTKDLNPQPKPGPTNCDHGAVPVKPTPPPTPAPLPPPAGAKNILYILVDDLRTQMSPYGHTFMQTPRLQQLAGESLVFDQAHVQGHGPARIGRARIFLGRVVWGVAAPQVNARGLGGFSTPSN